MTKYEYKIVKRYLANTISYGIANTDNKIAEKALNELGEAGWRLQNTITFHGTTEGLIFTREIEKK